MKKAKYIGSKYFADITVGKVYDIIEEVDEFYLFKDDDGDGNLKHKSSFEEYNYVMVKDFKSEQWEKRILLHDLGDRFFKRYIVVNIEDETAYLEGKSNIIVRGYVQMRPINEVEQKIEKLEQQLNK